MRSGCRLAVYRLALSTMKTNFSHLGLIVRKHTSWNVVLTFSLLVILTSIILLLLETPTSTTPGLTLLKQMHLLMAVYCLFLLWKKRKSWSTELAVGLFLFLYFPYYPMTWYQHVIYINQPHFWYPFVAIKLHFFALAFLIPGPFWLNFLMMVMFGFEAIAMWKVFNIPSISNVFLGFEPLTTILFGTVSLCLLLFRYHDEKIIRELSIKHAEDQAYERVAKIFLNIRDRTNTPIQTLKIAIFILKKKLPEDDDLIPIMEKSIAKLTDLNDILNQTEAHLKWHGTEMMTDEDIVTLMSELDRMKDNRGGRSD